jgi:BlaI family transcriptional regulator, penicillinase repressor
MFGRSVRVNSPYTSLTIARAAIREVLKIPLDKRRALLKNQHMAKPKLTDALSRRERQVMNILFRRGEATVTEVMTDLPDPPTYSAVRSILRILAEKKLITHREDGPRYVYLPAVNADHAADEALNQVVRTFFDGSADAAVTALLRMSDADLGEEEIAKLRDRIRKASTNGR